MTTPDQPDTAAAPAPMAYEPGNIFARILRGEIPATRVFEDDHVLAFRDIQPLAPTHVLVIPKGPYRDFDDFAARASDAEIAAWVRAVARIGRDEAVLGSGYRLIVNQGRDAHQEVFHLHMHLIGGRDLGRMIETT